MPETIHRTEPNDNHRYQGREFAVAPATINAKCFPDHAEMSWHTNVDISEMVWAVQEIVDESDYSRTDVGIRVSGTDLDIDDQILPFGFFLDSVHVDQLKAKRCQFDLGDIQVAWADRKEPLHSTLRESGARDQLPHQIALRGPLDEKKTIDIARSIYERSGDPALNSEQQEALIDVACLFIEDCTFQNKD